MRPATVTNKTTPTATPAATPTFCPRLVAADDPVSLQEQPPFVPPDTVLVVLAGHFVSFSHTDPLFESALIEPQSSPAPTITPSILILGEVDSSVSIISSRTELFMSAVPLIVALNETELGNSSTHSSVALKISLLVN